MTELYTSVLLKDGKIVSWKISPNLKEYPHDFYKDFIYSNTPMGMDVDENYTVEWMKFTFKNEDINNYVFEKIARTFFKFWEIDEENYMGVKPY